MLDQAQIETHITHNPDILGGKAIVRGTRVPVDLIVDFFNNGVTIEQIVEDYPDLTQEDVEAALAYARFGAISGEDVMAERKLLHIEPASETARLLELVGEEPITVESDGVRYRIEREERATIENYDPARALAALNKSAGALAGIDVEAFKREIREQRTQDSTGRPAQ